MRPSTVLSILACLASAGCSTTSRTASTEVWLCAYQLGNRYRDEAAKPDVLKYDTTVVNPVRLTEITYVLPMQGQAPEKHTMTCEAAPWGFGVIAVDGYKLERPEADAYSGNASETPSAQGRSADLVREAVRETGIHVHIPGIENF